MNHIYKLLQKPEFPRAAKYDPDWMLDNQMGPNAVWLMEWLSETVAFRPGMRVLDLGGRRAMSSMFLAKEFGVQVWAAENAHTEGALKGTLPDGETMQNVSYFGNMRDDDETEKDAVNTGVLANKHGIEGQKEMVPRARIELATRGFSVRCSTN